MNGRIWIMGWAIVLLVCPSAHGIITSDTKGSHRVTAGQPAFGINVDGVGLIAMIPAGGAQTLEDLRAPLCSAALIGDRYLLTAAHAFDPDKNGLVDALDFGWPYAVGFELSGESLILPVNAGWGEVPKVHFAPGWPGTFADLAIVELLTDAPSQIPRYRLYSGDRELGKPFVLVGYGSAGDGATGHDVAWDPRPTKRAGLNRVEDVADIPGWSTMLAFDFDSGQEIHNAMAVVGFPSDLGFGADEVNASTGDSGGPLLFNGVIAGITSNGLRIPPTDVNDQFDDSWGEVSFSTRVSSLEDFVRDSTEGTAGFVEWPFLFGDLDFDNDVDSLDLHSFLANWTGARDSGTRSHDVETGDLDFDGDVDSADLLSFLSSWTGDVSRYQAAPESTKLALLGSFFMLGLLASRRRGWLVQSHEPAVGDQISAR